MYILANLYFDIIAISQGIVFLLFCIPIVVLIEFEIFRIFCPTQGIIRAIITSLYANTVSGVVGIFCAEPMEDIIIDLVGSAGFLHDGSLFVSLLLLTYIMEVGAIYIFRRKLKVQKVFFCVGVANLVSYVVLIFMIVLVEFMSAIK